MLFVVAGALVVGAAQCQPTKPPAPTGLSISPTSHDFGEQSFSAGPTAATTFTVTNNGPNTSGILNVAVDPTGQFVTSADNCTGSTLDAGETCTVDAAFDPTTVLLQQADLVAKSDVVADGEAVAALSGTGDT